ncbi:hypothetical protein [Clostridium ihumii]|uniref:hypothetical protein n=1 Tax=Clostridium ihumii TaxID=1470356 RepID=UPI003D327E70
MKNLFKKNKRIVVCLLISLGIGFMSCKDNMSSIEYNSLLTQKENLNSQIVEMDNQITQNKNEVNKLETKKSQLDKIAREAAAEAEKIAKIEAEKLAKIEAEEATRVSQENQVESQPYIVNNGGVWISQTGKKYHSNPNCSNMKTPTQVSLEDAQSLGLTPCKKCY